MEIIPSPWSHAPCACFLSMLKFKYTNSVSQFLGAVMGARHFSNPVSISRKIMEESYHCALSGDGALKFAKEKGFSGICDPGDLVEEEISLKIDYEKYPEFVESYFGGKTSRDSPEFYTYDTVSAVAMDENGRLACATSTGNIKVVIKVYHWKQHLYIYKRIAIWLAIY
jgi:isoaspartyl peptidase/L-asparaginase-like protein (Ntn-hydrolase superfamily)